jgi:hypothetical protein
MVNLNKKCIRESVRVLGKLERSLHLLKDGRKSRTYVSRWPLSGYSCN